MSHITSFTNYQSIAPPLSLAINHHLLGDTSLRALLVSREHLQLSIINVLQLRAAQNAQDTSQGRVDRVEHAKRDIGLSLGGKLVGEASCIVALGQVCGIVDASCEIGNVDAGERVGCAGVSTNIEEFGLEMCQQMSSRVIENCWCKRTWRAAAFKTSPRK